MNPRITPDLEKFVATAPAGAVQVEGLTGATYWLLTEEAMCVRQYVQEGIDQADRGDLAPWNSEAIKTAGRTLKNN